MSSQQSAARPRTAQFDASRVSDILRNLERRITGVGSGLTDERARSALNECLSQIALLRSQFDAPIPGDQRQAARAPESAVVIVISANGQSFEAALHDLSIGGALVELDADELHGSACQVLLPGMAHSIDATADVSGHGKIRLLFPKLTGEDRIDLLKQIEGSSLRA